ncbi:hypothetical protein V3A08_07425 [Tenacibaculum maritimum]|uniref:hypothetical protein n=1 Tax=Tenacibaculum maritimum TaxID=107401 RepID=UPI0038761189
MIYTKKNKKTSMDVDKIKKLLKKGKFYDFFIDYVMTFDAMKREITEIVSENRKLEEEKALNIRIFRIAEVQKFIISNDLQEHFRSI